MALKYQGYYNYSNLSETQANEISIQVGYAFKEWARYIDFPDNVQLDVLVLSEDLPGNTLAAAWSKFFGSPAKLEMIQEIQGNGGFEGVVVGDPYDESHFDGRIVLDMPRYLSGGFHFDSNFDNIDLQTGSKIDLHRVMLHEVGHLLGFTSGHQDFDKFVQWSGGKPYFTGPNAVAANGGNWVPLRIDPTTGKASGHIDDVSDLMYYSQNGPDGERLFNQISSLNVAMLEDMGLPVKRAGSGDDIIWGYHREDDNITAGAGNDTIIGLSGNDTIWGGAGYDFVSMLGSSDQYILTDLGSGVWSVRDDYFNDNLNEGTDTLHEVEAVWFAGNQQLYYLVPPSPQFEAPVAVDDRLSIDENNIRYGIANGTPFQFGNVLLAGEGASDLGGTQTTTTGGIGISITLPVPPELISVNGINVDGGPVEFTFLSGVRVQVTSDGWVSIVDLNGLDVSSPQTLVGSFDYVIANSANPSLTDTGHVEIRIDGGINDIFYAPSNSGTTFLAQELGGGISTASVGGFGAGDDTFIGSPGQDTVSYEGNRLGLNASLKDLIATGKGLGIDKFQSIENLITGFGNDLVQGSSGNNLLQTGQGNDVLEGMAGTNALDGGSGWDKAKYSIASSAATIARTGNGTATISGAGFSDTLTGVEVAHFTDRDVAIRETMRSDMNGNGTSDMLLQSGGTVIDWIVSNGVAQTGNVVGGGVDGWTAVGTGDFNGDGTADVILQNGGTVVQWSLDNGVNAGGTLVGAGVDGWTVKGTGDFNSDGTTDVVLQNGGTVVAWTMQNGVAASGTVVGAGIDGWDVVGTGDFNGDGSSDILLQNGGTLVAWSMRDGANIGGNVLSSGIDGWQVVGTGDFNGDGTTDVVVKNGGTIVDLLVQNSVATTGNIIGLGLEAWDVVATGDYNGDGTADIALTSNGLVVNWTMQNGVVAAGNVLGGNGAFGVVA